MIEKYFEFPFKSRYFTYGNLNSKTEQIWFVFHGYGQLASYFIQNFYCLNPKTHFVVAPEGTNRFYLSGFDGRVGASWMTKEDRETDILNYKVQLDHLFNSLNTKFVNATINVLGFSQGTATASCWICLSRPQVHNLILWAGKLAFDIDLAVNKEYLSNLNVHLVVGDQDEYINNSKFEEYKLFLSDHKIDFKSTLFSGGHKIEEDILNEMAKALIK